MLSSSPPSHAIQQLSMSSLQTRSDKNESASITLRADTNLKLDVLADMKNIGSPRASDFWMPHTKTINRFKNLIKFIKESNYLYTLLNYKTR